MARITSPLTATEIKNAKPKDKTYKLYDGGGLYLSVMPSGNKVWRFDYTDNNKKRQTHTIGNLKFIGLVEARQERLSLQTKLFHNKNLKNKDENTFTEIFYAWFNLWKTGKSDSHISRAELSVKNYIFPDIGNMNIADITTHEIVTSLEKIDKKGSREVLNKTKSALKLCFGYAVAKGLRDTNPVLQIDNSVFSKQVKSNLKHLNKEDVYKIHKIMNDSDHSISRLCFEFMTRNLSRPIEAVQTEWSQWNEDDRLIVINADKMKMKNAHVIPVSNQSAEIIDKAKLLHENNVYIFSNEKNNKHIARPTIAQLITSYGVESTAHGFRHLASTILHESGLFESEIIEACLSHKDKNTVRATYNKAQYIEKRREILQWWSDFIDMCDTKENNLKALKKFNII